MDQTLWKQLPDVVMVVDGATLVVDSINREHPQTVWGRTPESMVGARLDAFIPRLTRELWSRAVQHTHDAHPDAPLRVNFRRVDGTLQPVDILVGAMPDGGTHRVAVLRHVSERARTAERELAGLVGASPVATLTFTRDRNIVTVNAAAHALLGLAPDDAVGRDVLTLVPEGDRAEFCTMLARLWAGEMPPPRQVVRLGRGQGVDVQERFCLVKDEAGEPMRVGLFLEDTQERMRLVDVANRLDDARGPPLHEGVPSRAMEDVWAAAHDAAARPDVPVLLLGETGVGKTTLARFIHKHSARGGGPFLELHCGVLDAGQLESELLGQEKGPSLPFKRGLLELAHGGSILLRDVGELPPTLQARLLQYLLDGTFRRVGGNRVLRSNVRIISTHQEPLETAVSDGWFREDLHQRLAAIHAVVVPLRQRLEDMPQLVTQLLQELAAQRGRRDVTTTEAAVSRLCRHDWPGNVGELRNVLERALILKPWGPLGAQDIPLDLPTHPQAALGVGLRDLGLEHMRRVVNEHAGNLSRAAAALGIDRGTLRRHLRQQRV
jgi:PAS domain S-box-containing protein